MSQEVSPEVLESLQRLARSCHARCNHPDYEYDTTETGRKTSEEAHPPEGHGWEVNVDKGDEGWDRLEYTEEHYWRRLKTDAQKDPVSIYKLDRVRAKPVSHELFRAFFVALWGKQIRKDIDRRVVSWDQFKTFARGEGTYGILQEAMTQAEKDEAFHMGIHPGYHWLGLELPGMRLMIPELDPIETTSMKVSCVNSVGTWSEWQMWQHKYGPDLNIDLQDAFRAIMRVLNKEV